MANRAAALRAAVQALHPGASVEARGKNWIRHRAPSGRVVLDTVIGALHYGASLDQEIDPVWQATTGTWQYQMLTAGYQAFSRNQLGVGTMYRVQIGTEFVEFQPLALNWVNDADSRQQITQPQSIAAQVVNGGTLRFPNGYGTGRHFQYETCANHLRKVLTIDSAANLPTPTVTGTPHLEIEFVLTKSAGVTEWLDGAQWDRSTRVISPNRVQYRTSQGATLWEIDTPRAWDSAGSEVIGQTVLRRQGGNRLVTIRVPRSWIQTAVFPVFLDPTIDVSAGASADDGGETSAGNVQIMATTFNVDQTNEWGAARFPGITIPAGATIDVAYLTLHFGSGAEDEPDVTISGEDVAAPAQYVAGTGTFTISTRTLTTASVAWSNADLGAPGSFNTPSLVSIVQELVDSYAPYSSGAMAFQWTSTNGTSTRDCTVTQFDHASDPAPALHIEYTEAASGPQPGVGAMTLTGFSPPMNYIIQMPDLP